MYIRLCYKISEEAGFTNVDDEPTEVYTCVKIPTKIYTIPTEEYKNLVEIGIGLVSDRLEINKEYITPITLNEYLDSKDSE